MKNLTRWMFVITTGLLLFCSSQTVQAQEDLVDSELEAEAASADSEAAIVEAQDARKRAAHESSEARKSVAAAEAAKRNARTTEADAKVRIQENFKLESAAKSKRQVLEKLRLEAEQKIASARARVAKSKVTVEQANAARDKAADDLRLAERSQRAAQEEAVDWDHKMKRALEEQRQAERKLAELRKRNQILGAQLAAIRKKAKAALPASQRQLQKTEATIRAEEAAIEQKKADLARWSSLRAKADQDVRAAQVGHQRNTMKLKEVERSVAQVRRQQFDVLTQRDCNVRDTPDTEGDVVGKVLRGSRLSVAYHDQTWVRVVGGASRGYVARVCVQ